MLDLPGAYSLDSTDSRRASHRRCPARRRPARPSLISSFAPRTRPICARNLRLVLSLKRLGLPMVVALNMSDIARRKGIVIDAQRLARGMGVPVVGNHTASRRPCVRALIKVLAWIGDSGPGAACRGMAHSERFGYRGRPIRGAQNLGVGGRRSPRRRDDQRSRRCRGAASPCLGPLILAVILFLVFQAVFAWAQVPMDAIKLGVAAFGNWLGAALPESMLKGLLVNGVLAGVGSVLVFLPQIIILFFFILMLEDSGYLPRAAFLLDRVMAASDCRAAPFIPLLSSLPARFPASWQRAPSKTPAIGLATIMIAPLMTCSARLPVYALIIGAFIPQRTVWGGLELQGVVCSGSISRESRAPWAWPSCSSAAAGARAFRR